MRFGKYSAEELEFLTLKRLILRNASRPIKQLCCSRGSSSIAPGDLRIRFLARSNAFVLQDETF